MDKPTILLKKVVKVYGKGDISVKALNSVDLNVQGATMVAIVGPSGSGKSTILHIIGAMDRVSSGYVEVTGMDLTTLNERGLTRFRGEKVGFVFQTFNLIPNLTALENVTLPMEFVRRPWKERKGRARMLLEEVGLLHRTKHRPSELSGGEQQRVAVARALANDPAILLADEPTGNLDSKTGQVIYELLRKVARKRTVVIVTHDTKLVENADKVIHISDGVLE